MSGDGSCGGSPALPNGKGLLRFMTCGSVDDGKSTLVGRLLYDSGLLHEDQLRLLERQSSVEERGDGDLDFSLLMHGLEAEREQSITIDVGYRYFATGRRSFIVADAPGHEQFTCNMATGASCSELAILLVDASKGLLQQTRRHALICYFFGIRHFVLAVNKMDLVRYDPAIFEEIVSEYQSFTKCLPLALVTAIPTSARFGENVVHSSQNMPWYNGAPLLKHLESVELRSGADDGAFRLPVQWINRPSSDFRGYSGTVAGGAVCPGDKVLVAGRAAATTIDRIVTAEGELKIARAGDAVTLTLADPIDVARGDILVSPDRQPDFSDQFNARVLWMGAEPLLVGRSYLMRSGTRWVPVTISEVEHRLDVNNMDRLPADALNLNEIGMCRLSAALPVAFDLFEQNAATGAFILVDRYDNRTVGGGMIVSAHYPSADIRREKLAIDKVQRGTAKLQRPCIVWLTGLPGAGKTTIARLVEERLYSLAYHTYMLDGDNVRHGLSRDLGFTDVDRVENIRRAGEVAKLMLDAGLIVLCAFVSPFAAERAVVRSLVEAGEFIEVFVDTPIEECIRRDPKGLYARARQGKLANLTGLGSPYQPPTEPELVLKAAESTAESLADRVVLYLRDAGFLS